MFISFNLNLGFRKFWQNHAISNHITLMRKGANQMFLSMHNWMRAEQIGTTIQRLAKCGYDAIEIDPQTATEQ